jgi:hypothetical protein
MVTRNVSEGKWSDRSRFGLLWILCFVEVTKINKPLRVGLPRQKPVNIVTQVETSFLALALTRVTLVRNRLA